MSEQTSGRASFGLDMEKMVVQAWRIFVNRPLTILGVSALVIVVGILVHVFLVGAFFWLPFTLCIPYAAVQIQTKEKSDRIFLGWIDRYPTLLAVFLPAALAFILLLLLVLPPVSGISVVEKTIEESSETIPYNIDWKSPRLGILIPILIEKILAFGFGLAALLALRKNLTAVDAVIELFSTWRHALEVFLLAGVLALFSLSGILVCCVGIVATTTFAWICLGVAYYQMFEE
jgi:hypothetical protein